MKDPCKRCVLKIMCKEFCIFREEFTKFWTAEFEFYNNNCRKSGQIKDFDKKYYIALQMIEEIEKENQRFWSTSTTSYSGCSVSSSSSIREWKKWKRGSLYNFHNDIPNHHRKDDYLKPP